MKCSGQAVIRINLSQVKILYESLFHLESLFYFLSLTAGLVLGSLCGLMTVTTLLTSQLHPPPKKNDKSEKNINSDNRRGSANGLDLPQYQRRFMLV